MTSFLILPTREIVAKVREVSSTWRGVSLEPKSLVEYVLMAWMKSGEELWLRKQVLEGRSSSYINYVQTYITDDLFEGDEFSAMYAFDAFLAVEEDFWFIFDRLKLDNSSVILSEPKWLGGDIAIKVFD